MIPSQAHAFPDEGPDKTFASFLAAGQFNIQRCENCAQHVFYPRLVCPHCGGQNLQWVAASGAGTVYSTSVNRGMPEGDYNISLVDLDEGPRMLSRVVDVAPEQVSIGLRVHAFVGAIDGKPVVLFRPMENA